jgi:hypothetical protein
MPFGWIGLVLAMVAAQQAPGGQMVHALSPRELAWQADTVVVAVPLGPKQVTRFKVQRVLKGRPQVGQEIQVDGCSAFFLADGELPAARLLEVCLFLTAEAGDPAGQKFRLVPTGLACLSRGSWIYRPLPEGQPIEFRLRPRGKSETWDALLDQFQADVQEVQRLQWARDLSPSRGRNQALLDWIDRHRREFLTEGSPDRIVPGQPSLARGGPVEQQELYERGWRGLERLPFMWVLQSGILPDCWRAIELFAEIYSGQCLGLDQTIFNSREGRDFLTRTACDDRQLAGSRRRALRLLATARTLRGKTPLDASEQTELLERMRSILQVSSSSLRRQAAKTVLEVSRPISGLGDFNGKLLPELLKAFQAEQLGETREALAESVRLIGGEKEWQTLTGQALGLAGTIQTPGAREDQMHFWLMLRGREVRVTEVPTLVLERMDPITKVFILEKKTQPLPAAAMPQPTGWAGGWDGSLPLFIEFAVQGLEPGNWRIRVEGVSGKERHRWRSENRMFKVVAVARPDGMVPVDRNAKQRRMAEVPVEE